MGGGWILAPRVHVRGMMDSRPPSSRGQALRGQDEGMGPRIREDTGRGRHLTPYSAKHRIDL